MFLNSLLINRLEHRETLALLIGSVPLAGEARQLMRKGELLAVSDGQVVATKASRFRQLALVS